ncbi:MAG: RNA-binding S4 domain-containing protein [Tissierellia bacterium]|nr:RNA-binding S4 domain-containing protein [Tissierellia bacterium]
MTKIEFKAEMIRLKDLLKITSLIPTGGMAKNIIRDGYVKLNGSVCDIPGKKLKPGDQVEYEDNIIEIK